MKSRYSIELLARSASTLSRPLAGQTSSSSSLWQKQTSWTTQRCLNTSAPLRAAQPPPHKANEAAQQAISKKTPNPTPARSSSDAQTSAAIDGLFSSVGMAPRRQQQQRTGSKPDSADAVSNAYVSHTFGSRFSKPTPNLRPKGLMWENMTMPEDGAMTGSLPKAPALREEDMIYPRLNPTTGRTVDLDPSKGRDIVRGIGMLGSLMARNKVKSDFNRQKFHERPGLRRKRLKTDRWRYRFKQGFEGMCGRVTELTKKGW
ncbi:hypothetical protein BU24DRAFT_419021 [Aaosphaeria arxii CBS 175.79]|uniref:Ribosomal protein S21 n=1 Tax=Aaosphaeria arxii CBS 175.79 TaxID=1450172 RepID=A0A6A5Y1P6_9PLEO|nr:uncharacterized protein BU24DRAFT_419021 [Aaosphaeria arxii CBS 175.79]KAF2019402.1 hypothetical protein BU24DRAFT_419021 [Aaosphaeria arxii CBS 175.79]